MLRVVNSSLWYRVLSARYGMEGGRLKGGGREASLWWRDISLLCRESWFTDHVDRSLGNGKHTLFWSDVWCGVVWCLLKSGSVGYMSCRYLNKHQFLICVS